VGLEHGAQCRDDRRDRCRHQQDRERTVIEPELGRRGDGLTATHPLGRRQQDLFLHADVLQQAGAELAIGGAIDRAGLSHGTEEKPVETGMILG
jgi:hypothetical protein